MLLSEHKKLICLKQKTNRKGGYQLPYLNQVADHLNRQFLITASSFPYSSKNSTAEHIHNLPTYLTLINTLTHINKHTNSHIDSLSLSHTHTHTHTHIHTLTHTETILELYGKVEAVVRNCLLR